MVFMNITFLLFILTVGVLFFYNAPYSSSLSDSATNCGPYLYSTITDFKSKWYQSLEDFIYSGTVGMFILKYFLSNSPLLIGVNVLLIAKIANLFSSIKILNRYKEDKGKVRESYNLI